MVRVLAVEDAWVPAKRTEENKARNSERRARGAAESASTSSGCTLAARAPPFLAPREGSGGGGAPVVSRDSSPRGGASLLARRHLPATPRPAPTAAQLVWSWGPERLAPATGQRRAPRRRLASGIPPRREKLARRRLLIPVKRAPSRCGALGHLRPGRLRRRLCWVLLVPEFLPRDPLTGRCEYGLLAPPPRPEPRKGSRSRWSRGRRPGDFGRRERRL